MRKAYMLGFSYFQVLILIGLFSCVSALITRMMNKIIMDDVHNSQLQVAIINLSNIHANSMYKDGMNKLPGQKIKHQNGNTVLMWRTNNKTWLCHTPKIKNYACISNQ